MAIEGLIILDSTGRPIIQSGFRATSPAFPLLHIDALNNALSKAARPEDIDPVIFVNAYQSPDSPSACCHVKCGDVRILCPISGDVDPLFAFAFLQTFIDILREYFGTVSAATLTDNFDVVYQLLEETLDSSGHPLTTSPNTLRDIVLPPSLLSKLLSVAGANINTSFNSGSGAAGAFSSPIPWRKAGLRYNNNEIYFDVVEELKAIVNKHGTALASNVWGKIETNAKLSGTPDLLLTFTNAHVLADCSFHPCVRLQKWTRDKSLSFVPPDGRFTLAEYRYSPSSTATSRFTTTSATTQPSTPAASGKDSVAVPFALKSAVEVGEHTCTFDFTLTSRLTTRAIANLAVDMYLGEGAEAARCVVARAGAGGGGFGNARGGAGLEGVAGSGTSWAYDPKKRVLRWEIPSAPPSSSWTMKGSFASPATTPRPAHALQIRFDIPSHTFSALKIDQLKVKGEMYKPYKGVRGRSVGDVEWRW